MKIAIDLDSVQNDMIDLWIWKYNRRYNDNVRTKDIKGWDIQNYCKKCTLDDLYLILSDENFFRNVNPMEYAREVIDKLRNNGHEVFTVTAYFAKTCVDKTWWLQNYMGFDSKDIIFCNKKHLIRADMLIDDGIHNLEKFEGIKVLYDAPHNQHIQDFEFDIRVKNWKELEIYLKSINVI